MRHPDTARPPGVAPDGLAEMMSVLLRRPLDKSSRTVTQLPSRRGRP
jgi:hypothetical protein